VIRVLKRLLFFCTFLFVLPAILCFFLDGVIWVATGKAFVLKRRVLRWTAR
jgi:hypothetical protein